MSTSMSCVMSVPGTVRNRISPRESKSSTISQKPSAPLKMAGYIKTGMMFAALASLVTGTGATSITSTPTLAIKPVRRYETAGDLVREMAEQMNVTDYNVGTVHERWLDYERVYLGSGLSVTEAECEDVEMVKASLSQVDGDPKQFRVYSDSEVWWKNCDSNITPMTGWLSDVVQSRLQSPASALVLRQRDDPIGERPVLDGNGENGFMVCSVPRSPGSGDQVFVIAPLDEQSRAGLDRIQQAGHFNEVCDPHQPPPGFKRLNVILGSVFSVVGVLGLAGLACWFCCRRRPPQVQPQNLNVAGPVNNGAGPVNNGTGPAGPFRSTRSAWHPAINRGPDGYLLPDQDMPADDHVVEMLPLASARVDGKSFDGKGFGRSEDRNVDEAAPLPGQIPPGEAGLDSSHEGVRQMPPGGIPDNLNPSAPPDQIAPRFGNLA